MFARFCAPVYRHFSKEHVTLLAFVQFILNACLPGMALLLMAFYGFLHCWLNAFAEMLRFGDRLFYKVSKRKYSRYPVGCWFNQSEFDIFYLSQAHPELIKYQHSFSRIGGIQQICRTFIEQ